MWSYNSTISGIFSGSRVRVTIEGYSVRDVNGDGFVDLILANVGPQAFAPILPTDQPIAILLGSAAGTFSLADTNSLGPSGWINDFIFVDQDRDGSPTIVGIDHGREIGYDPINFSPIRIYDYENGSFVNLTGSMPGNYAAFNHNASSAADLNNDGYLDVAIAVLGPTNLRVLAGGSSDPLQDATDSFIPERYTTENPNFRDAGAAGIIDYQRDGDFDILTLPYAFNTSFPQRDVYAVVYQFQNGQFDRAVEFNARNIGNERLPDGYGYSFVQFADLDKDGREDFVALAETPYGGDDSPKIFVLGHQTANGFELSRAMPDEPFIMQLPGSSSGSRSDFKFQLIDMNGDGYLDLFWPKWFGAESGQLGAGVFLNDGTGHFEHNQAISDRLNAQINWTGTARPQAADVNDDGIADFVVITTVPQFEAPSEGNQYGFGFQPIIFVSNSGELDASEQSGAPNTLVQGTAARDILTDSVGNGSYFLGDGNDYILHLSGNDTINGGAGLDTIVTQRSSADFVRALNDQGARLTSSQAVLSLSDVERIQFADNIVAFDIQGNAGQVYRLYQAAFDRTPDLRGLSHNVHLVDTTHTLDEMSDAFVVSAEFRGINGQNPTDTQFLTALYLNVLNRQPDQAGLNGWLQYLASGEYNRGAVLIGFSESAENHANVDPSIIQGITLDLGAALV